MDDLPKAGTCRNKRSGATWSYTLDGCQRVRVFDGPPGNPSADRVYLIADFLARFTPYAPTYSRGQRKFSDAVEAGLSGTEAHIEDAT